MRTTKGDVMMKNNYCILLQYDGTKYNGWQRQGNTSNTIQSEIERVLKKMTDQDIEVIGSGRTDAGTHAYGQVANFYLDWKDSEEVLMERLNTFLPEDIAVIAIEEKEERFHARLNAKSKIYEYRIYTANIPPVFQRKYVFWNKTHLDVEAMKRGADYLIGTYDFKSFTSNKRTNKSTVRTIYGIEFEKIDQEVRISFHGSGFLYHMVRIMIGTLIEIGEGKKKPEDIPEILSALDREKAGFTAPAIGLALMHVRYPEKL